MKRRAKEHCDFFISEPMPSFSLNVGDCIVPRNGRFQPSKCNGLCRRYNDTTYKLKLALRKGGRK